MYLVVDCETVGLPRDWRAPIQDLDNWPRAVQVAWKTYDSQHRETSSRCWIVKPEGYRIPPEAARIHGITHLLVVLRVEPVLEEGSAHELQRSVKHQESDVREALVLQRRDECAQCRDQLIGMPEPSSTLP